jgi:RNA recognition motif-containing protein
MSMNSKIFVANLSRGVTEEDLRRVFGAHGIVSEASVLMDRVSGQSRGLAFVTMRSGAEAQMAMDRLNATILEGRALVLNSAKPRRVNPGPNQRQCARGHRRNWRHRRRV